MDVIKAILFVALFFGAVYWLESLEPTEPCPVDAHYTRIDRNGDVECQGGEAK